MKSYAADFETTTDPDDCRVWAAGVCEVGKPDTFICGNSIEWFIEWCRTSANCQVYFHNLAFDGSFIIDWLLRNGWTWAENDQQQGWNFFTTLIGDNNAFYSIQICFNKYRRVKIYDSLKIAPLSVRDLAGAYNLPMSKGDIDYTEYRAPGHILTYEETDYLRRDVVIVAEVMKKFLDEGLDHMTIGSNAMHDFLTLYGGMKKFRKLYPELKIEEDMFIRKAYRGGWTYCNSRIVGQDIGEGVVYDVNSLYPYVMYECELPYGHPHWFSGEPTGEWPLWVAAVTCIFEIKTNHYPCIQLKGNVLYNPREYLLESVGVVTMCLTSVDWALYNEQYNIHVLEWHGGYGFGCTDELFKQYIDKWITVKNDATVTGNKGLRTIAKLMLNSLYGKFATRRVAVARMPALYDEDDGEIVHYPVLDPEERKTVYLPVGVFITSYARAKTVRAAQANYERFLYADTDSIHLVGTEPGNIEIDDVELGKWKCEGRFKRARFLRAKCYMEEYENGKTIHVAGMPKMLHEQVTFENFALGAVYKGKLYQKRVKGGIVLVPGDVELKR